MAWALWFWTSAEAYSVAEVAEGVPQACSTGLNEVVSVIGHLTPDSTPYRLVTLDFYCLEVHDYSVMVVLARDTV